MLQSDWLSNRTLSAISVKFWRNILMQMEIIFLRGLKEVLDQKKKIGIIEKNYARTHNCNFK